MSHVWAAARPLEHLVLFWSKGIRRAALVGLVLPSAFLGARASASAR